MNFISTLFITFVTLVCSNTQLERSNIPGKVIRSESQKASCAGARCPYIKNISPKSIPWATTNKLNLAVGYLPKRKFSYVCVFSVLGEKLESPAIRTKEGLTCVTPDTLSLSNLPEKQHYITATVSIRTDDLAATNLTFYDCRSYASCTECVTSRFPCNWCIGGHRCTHSTEENCRNDVIVTNFAARRSIRKGPGYCPKIVTGKDVSDEILAPSSVEKRVLVTVKDIISLHIQTKFKCRFQVLGTVKTVHAVLLGDTIYCESTMFTNDTPDPIITANLDILWDENKPLDNPENIHILIYRCDEMAQNCSTCLDLPEKYDCGWCGTSCVVRQLCLYPFRWLEGREMCPVPTVTPPEEEEEDYYGEENEEVIEETELSEEIEENDEEEIENGKDAENEEEEEENEKEETEGEENETNTTISST